MKTLKKIPDFISEEEEHNFWNSQSSLDFVEQDKAKNIKFANLKKSIKTISLRLPEDMLESLKVKANSLDIPYQSFIKMILKKGLLSF